MTDTKILDSICAGGFCEALGEVDPDGKCKGCPLLPMRMGNLKIPNVPPLRLSSNDTWQPCKTCEGATVRRGQCSDEIIIEMENWGYCLDCPAKQVRDSIEEGEAEVRSS